MKLFLIFMIMFINYPAFAQGLTKDGKITTNGSEYVNKNGAIGSAYGVDKNGKQVTAITTVAVGDAYQGGIVAYILVSGDPGYDANTQHGLIAAVSDQTSTGPGSGIRWYNGTYTLVGTSASAIGTGAANTTTIIAVQGSDETSYAAGLARAYTGGGYTDWYLPSIDELKKLYSNKAAITGFADYPYYSSTERSGLYAHYTNFQSGLSYDTADKAQKFYVRAVRSF